MTRAELQILLSRYLQKAEDGDFLVVDCGRCFAQTAVNGGNMAVEVRGEGLAPDLMGKIDERFADFRSGSGGTSQTEPGVLSLDFAHGDQGVAAAMTGALDLLASATGQPLVLTDGAGAFMPRRKGFLGLGGFGSIL